MKAKRSEIGKRAFYELQMTFETNKDAMKALGMTHRQHMYNWTYGGAPSAIYLQRLYANGIDVFYILTGKRSEKTENVNIEVSGEGIGARAYEECLRIWGNIEDATDDIDASAPIVIQRWRNKVYPDAVNMAMLCEFGADIKYILTGERTNEN